MTRILLATLFLFTSCATRRHTDGNVAKIREGMTPEQVRAVLGWPWKEVRHPLQPSKITWRFVMRREDRETGKMRQLGGVASGSPVQVAATRSVYREIELVFIDGKLSKK